MSYRNDPEQRKETIKRWIKKNHKRYREYQRLWRIKNPEKAKAITKRNTEQIKKANKMLRLKIINILGGRCLKCGFEDVRALQIDHVNGGGKRDRALSPNDRSYIKKVLLSIENNENKYQLLCANCNWIKIYENRELYLQKADEEIGF